MATGGTIPSNRTQTVTFYDTTGIIEKHKNIYYAPMFTTAGGEVRERYLSTFNGVCPPSSVYSNISISSWSPQDRTLVIKGNIDDFRLVTEEGECLNYFIITRNITKGEGQSAVTNIYYYAFFITEVEQSGGSSITISCVPDDFTNVFYLHNKETTTVGYDPFNDKMKNCHVNRQHYNRVKLENISRTLSKALSTRSSQPVSTTLYESDLPLSNFSFTEVSHTGSGTYSVSLVHTDKYRIVGEISSGIAGTLYSVSLSLSFDEKVITPDNIKVFYNQEETYKYKYQFKDYKFPISLYDGAFTDSEKSQIENQDNFTYLPTALRQKILLTCLSYLCIEYKSREGQGAFMGAKGNYTYVGNYRCGNRVNVIQRPNLIVSFPVFIVPEYFSKYENKIKDYSFYETIGSDELPLATIYDITKSLSENAMSDKIYSVYLVKDIYLPKEKITVSHTSGSEKITFNVYNVFSSEPTQSDELKNLDLFTDLYPIVVRKEYETDLEHQDRIFLIKNFNTNQITYNSDYVLLGLVCSGYDHTEFSINIQENIPNLINNYYEPVLETEPYRFYSLSYIGGYELIFNKNRYYHGLSSDIYFYSFSEINGGLKIGLIPRYTVDNVTISYFNEGLVFTLASGLPLVSDSYSSYYYQNMAQMKNQYAVTNYNSGMDLLQHFGISGPNAVGYAAGKAGISGKSGGQVGATAFLETGNQVMQMADEVVDWAQAYQVVEMNQKALLADIGARPDSLKQVGSDLFYDINTKQLCYFLNHYSIDDYSYNSISKLLERTGYQVNRYDTLNTFDRVGWNFIKLNGFDWNPTVDIMVSQEESIRAIFLDGVTLLHNKTYLTSGHNYETILEGGN